MSKLLPYSQPKNRKSQARNPNQIELLQEEGEGFLDS